MLFLIDDDYSEENNWFPGLLCMLVSFAKLSQDFAFTI